MPDNGAPPRAPLNGWKEISAYLGKSVRSVQRWESSLGLPVHRIRTADGQIVYADRDEIDQWRRRLDGAPPPEPEDPLDPESLPESRPEATPPNPAPEIHHVAPRSAWTMARLALAGAGVALFAGGVLVGWALERPSPVAISVAITGREIQGLNQQGAAVWSYRFDHDISGPQRGVPQSTLVDLDGDDTLEWLIPVRSAPAGAPAATSDAMYAFTQDGHLEWTVRPDQKLTYPDRTMSAPWRMTDFVVSPSAPRRTWISFAHHTGSSSFVLEISPRGDAALRYVQFGTIFTVEHWMTPSGGFLAAGGVSVEYRQPALALLPENGPAASMPIDDPHRSTCDECPRNLPQRLFLFPRSELTAIARQANPYVYSLRTLGSNLEAMSYQGGGDALFVINPDFSVQSFQFAQNYWAAHKQLELKGELNHRADACPEQSAPQTIREWTAARGWAQSTVLSGSARAAATVGLPQQAPAGEQKRRSTSALSARSAPDVASSPAR